jgi:hypothetical protein
MKRTYRGIALLGGVACVAVACSDEPAVTDTSSVDAGSVRATDSSFRDSASSRASDASDPVDAALDAQADAAVDAGPKCAATSCAGKGMCVDSSGSIVCTCNPGYAGATCATCAVGYQDKDKNNTCLLACAPATCGTNGTCDDNSGTATCACNAGYTGAACDNCATGFQDKDKNKVCTAACAPATCGTNGACDDNTGTATCACNAGYTGAACNTCAGGYQDKDANGTCLASCAAGTCSGNGTCSDASGTAACTCTGNFTGAACNTCLPGFSGTACDTCVAGKFGPRCDYDLVYDLNIPANGANWDVPANVPYTTNNSGVVGAFTRVAYRMTLNAQTVWVEMDAFTANKGSLGIPVDGVFDGTAVSNLTVLSTSPAVANIAVPVSGALEFWSDCYNTGGGDPNTYDYRDTRGGGTDCYGSFQIHVGQNTLFAFNAWSWGNSATDIGFGNQVGGSGHPDWTFSQNSPTYTTRRLEVFAK